MRVRILLAAGLAGSLCVTASARDRGGTLSIWGGYTAVSMSDVNDNLDRTQTVIGDLGSVTRIQNGYSLSAEGLFYVAPGLQIGPRVEYIVPNQGKVSVDTLVASGEAKQELSLVPIMVGGRYMLKDLSDSPQDYSDNYAFSIGAFAGWGLAYGKSTLTTATPFVPNTSVSNSTSYDGSGFVGDALLGFQVRLSRSVALGIDAGYRFANIPEMNTSGSGGGGGGLYAPAKAPVTDASGSKLKFDFSGFFANAGLNFLF